MKPIGLHVAGLRCLLPAATCLFLLTACNVTQPVFKIGLVAPFEGRYRAVGYDVVWAVRMAVRERNTAGGAGGYAVELVSLDDGGDPASAAEQARKLALDPAVLAVIGHWRDETTLAALPVYEQASVALIAAGVGPPDLTQSEAAFRHYPSDAAIENVATRYAESVLGLQPLVLVRVTSDLPQIHEQQARAVFLDLDLVRAADVVAGEAVPVTWIGDARLADPQYPALVGAVSEGTLVALGAPLPADLPQPGDFAARYAAIAGAPPDWRAPLAYDAAHMLFEAIAQAAGRGVPSRSSVADELRSIRYQGVVGPVSFDEQGGWREARVYIYRWQDGDLILQDIPDLQP
jgi:ABC-type branched-subunit amino acid transport system substrate-binding protein